MTQVELIQKLFVAVKHNDIKEVQSLLKQGVDVNTKDVVWLRCIGLLRKIMMLPDF